MNKILILGASGLVGGNCLKYFTEMGLDVKGTHLSYQTKETVYFDTLNLKDSRNFDIAAFNPDVILHAGALTWVDYCEENEEESYKKTILSCKNVIGLCKTLRAKMIYISTDYVFDGKNGPYNEEARTNPLSVYARHKLLAEQATLSELVDSLVLRITNVYGDEERNKNFVARLFQQFAQGKALSLRLPYDQYATPVNAYDIARSLYLLLRDYKKGIYHIASTDFVNRCELAARVLAYFPGNLSTIIPTSTSELNQIAERPLMAGLLTSKFSSEYPDFMFSNVDDYLKKKLSEATTIH